MGPGRALGRLRFRRLLHPYLGVRLAGAVIACQLVFDLAPQASASELGANKMDLMLQYVNPSIPEPGDAAGYVRIRRAMAAKAIADAYDAFVGASPPPGTVRLLNPSGYPESQGAFAERVRREAESRLARPCRLEIGGQAEFPEPPVRINTDLLDAQRLGWSETRAWDEFVAYYAP
jgi:hypothetical protein